MLGKHKWLAVLDEVRVLNHWHYCSSVWPTCFFRSFQLAEDLPMLRDNIYLQNVRILILTEQLSDQLIRIHRKTVGCLGLNILTGRGKVNHCHQKLMKTRETVLSCAVGVSRVSQIYDFLLLFFFLPQWSKYLLISISEKQFSEHVYKSVDKKGMAVSLHGIPP